MATPSAGLQKDKATEPYWSEVWEKAGVPDYEPIERRSRSEQVYLHPFFKRHLEPMRGASIIEVGCGNSTWLPYFAHEFGMKVSGLDYSPVGANSAREVLKKAGVEGDIHLADVFSPPENVIAAHDAVVSLGVIEHFLDTSEIVAAAARLVKPGGLVLSTLPNLSGRMGTAQKILERRVYDVHVPLSAEDVRRGHEQAGLEVIECEYACPYDFHMNHSAGPARKIAHKVLMRLTRTMWSMERVTGPLTPNRGNATYILCAARVPA